MLFHSFVLFFLSVHLAQAFRALYLANNIGYSHIEYTGRLADALVDAGHKVVSFLKSKRLLFLPLGLCRPSVGSKAEAQRQSESKYHSFCGEEYGQNGRTQPTNDNAQ